MTPNPGHRNLRLSEKNSVFPPNFSLFLTSMKKHMLPCDCGNSPKDPKDAGPDSGHHQATGLVLQLTL